MSRWRRRGSSKTASRRTKRGAAHSWRSAGSTPTAKRCATDAARGGSTTSAPTSDTRCAPCAAAPASRSRSRSRSASASASTASSFGYVDSLLFRPIPARGARRARRDVQRRHARPADRPARLRGLPRLSQAERRLRRASPAMAGVPLNVADPRDAGSGGGDMVWGEMVTENFFTVLGMTPGRGPLLPGDRRAPGRQSVRGAELRLLAARFRGDPRHRGRVVRLNGTEFTVIGVAPRGFRGMRMFGFWPEMWVPVGMHNVVMPGSTDLLAGRGGGWMMTRGRPDAPGLDRARTDRRGRRFARAARAGLSRDQRQH